MIIEKNVITFLIVCGVLCDLAVGMEKIEEARPFVQNTSVPILEEEYESESDGSMIWNESNVEADTDINAVDDNGMTRLHWAVANNKKEIFADLIRKNARVDIEDNDKKIPLHYAIKNRGYKLFQTLIERGSDICARDKWGDTILHWIALKGNKKIGEIFFQKAEDVPVDINAKDQEGETPLHIAVEQNKEVMVALLFAHNVNVNIVDNNGKTPLHVAALKSSEKIFRMLVERGAAINATESIYGWTPLHCVIYRNAFRISKSMVELLFNSGAAINIKDKDGYTPLMFAALKNSIGITEFLISKGAEVGAKNNKGQTALDLYRERYSKLIKEDEV